MVDSKPSLKQEGLTIDNKLAAQSQKKKQAIIKITTRPLNLSSIETESSPPRLHSNLRQYSQIPILINQTKH